MEKYDGVYFSRNQNGEDWNFSFMIINGGDTSDDSFVTHPVGFVYKILHHRPKGEKGVDVSEAVIGDPNHYIKNMVKANQDGLILKKCERAEKIFESILKKVNEYFEKGAV
jgi:hypothetical protein